MKNPIRKGSIVWKAAILNDETPILVKLKILGSVVKPYQTVTLFGNISRSKYRTDKAKVLGFYKFKKNGFGSLGVRGTYQKFKILNRVKLTKNDWVQSWYTPIFHYCEGAIVTPAWDFATDPNIGCGGGIHFFRYASEACDFILEH